jgi:hypothetical protein
VSLPLFRGELCKGRNDPSRQPRLASCNYSFGKRRERYRGFESSSLHHLVHRAPLTFLRIVRNPRVVRDVLRVRTQIENRAGAIRRNQAKVIPGRFLLGLSARPSLLHGRFRGLTVPLQGQTVNGNAKVFQRLPGFRSAQELIDYCA